MPKYNMPAASEVTKLKRLNIVTTTYKFGIGKPSGDRAIANPRTASAISIASKITKENKSAVVILPSVTFVSWSSPNAILSYNSLGKTITEYGLSLIHISEPTRPY